MVKFTVDGSLAMRIKGKILRHKDITKKFGVYVNTLDYNLSKNQIQGKVSYFPLDQIGKREGWGKVVKRDDHFVMPRSYFEDNFEVLMNPDNLKSFEDAVWSPINELYTKER